MAKSSFRTSGFSRSMESAASSSGVVCGTFFCEISLLHQSGRSLQVKTGDLGITLFAKGKSSDLVAFFRFVHRFVHIIKI
jgi:hypothetical protein